MDIPLLSTKHCFLTIADISHAARLCDYYLRNKNFLEPWEPKRNPGFYTEKYWETQINYALRLFSEKQGVRMILLNKEKSQIIGTCNFSNVVRGSFLACHLGYSIDQEFEGKGIMFETVKAGIKYMQDEFQMHRIMANHIPNNYRSAKLLKKLGFEQEGYAKSYLKINGKWQDHILNSLILPSK